MTEQSFSLKGFQGLNYDKGASKRKQILWMLTSTSILTRWWLPNKLRLHILKMFGAKIDTGVLIRHNVKIHWPWKLTIGADSWIGESVWILNLEPVIIGHDTCVSQDVLICTGSHSRRSATFEFDNAAIEIGDHVWIAARSTILRGVKINSHSTVGATALITQDVPPDSIVLAPRASTNTRQQPSTTNYRPEIRP